METGPSSRLMGEGWTSNCSRTGHPLDERPVSLTRASSFVLGILARRDSSVEPLTTDQADGQAFDAEVLPAP